MLKITSVKDLSPGDLVAWDDQWASLNKTMIYLGSSPFWGDVAIHYFISNNAALGFHLKDSRKLMLIAPYDDEKQ